MKTNSTIRIVGEMRPQMFKGLRILLLTLPGSTPSNDIYSTIVRDNGLGRWRYSFSNLWRDIFPRKIRVISHMR